MELIKEIFNRDILLQQKPDQDDKGERDVRYRLRRAARALLFRDDRIAVLNARNLSLHKLPGGGIEGEESISEGLEREILEETGCKIYLVRELGVVMEYRDEFELLQVSYVFTGNVVGDFQEPVYTQKEKDEGFVLEWMPVDEAFDFMKNKDKPESYAGKFIRMRDMAILDYYLRRK